MLAMTMMRETFPVGPLQCNCTILGDSETGQGYVFDPGGDADRIIAAVERLGVHITAIIHTHAHLDHILAAGEIKKQTGAPIYLHLEDGFLWNALENQCRAFRIPYVAQPEPDYWVSDDELLPCGEALCIHTPGHTPGSMCYYFERDRLLIAGDTLFLGSIGRTDLWGGDARAIERSIRQRLYVLDEDASVVPGHGPHTSIGHEMRHNLFVRARP